jgi:hypothetical protein
LPLIFPLFLPSFNRERSRKKLQSGTVLPVVSDLYREFAELSAHFDLRAIQSAQKQLRMLCNFHENTFGLLIFYTNYAIL